MQTPDEPAPPPLSRSEVSMLREAVRLARHDLLLRIEHRNRRHVAESLVQRGLLDARGMGVVCDGDGYALQPERERPCYALTDAGRAAAGAT